MGRTVRVVSAAVCAIAALTLTGCSTGSGLPDGSDVHVVIDPLDPQTLDADTTATTAMSTILTWQPSRDGSKSDALARARRWLGGDLATTIDSGATAQVRPDPDWQGWADSKDVVTATCVRADSTSAAPEGMRTLIIDVECTQTVLHTSGRTTRITPQTWRTTITRTDNGWRLTEYRLHT